METVWKIVAIAVGGSAGAVARYLMNVSPLAGVFSRFPLQTFVINVTGSFLIGFLTYLFADRYVVNDNIRSAVIIGFLGAFTTFSTFEIEMYALVRDGALSTGFLYLLLSVFLGFVAVALGVMAARQI